MAGTGSSIPCPWNVDSRFQPLPRFRASYIEQAPAVKKVDNAIHGINPYQVDSAIGPLQLVIHVVQNRRAGEQKSHYDKQDKQRKLQFRIMYVLCLSCPSAAFSLQRGGFVPCEWLAVKGPIGFPNTYPLDKDLSRG